MSYLTMQELDLKDKQIMIREDLNVPIKNGQITNDARIRAALPTLQHALRAGAAVTVLSHLGRPSEGKPDKENSLGPVAKRLEELLGQPVRFELNWQQAQPAKVGEVVLWENVRFNKGETANDPELARQLTAHCDIFVMDAFAAAHRAHASTCAAIQYAPIACAGPLLTKEINALTQALENPKRPLIGIVGGAKVSTKLTVLQALLDKVDCLIVGGGIANTFLAAKDLPIGKSLYEPELVATAHQLLDYAETHGKSIPLPIDAIVAKTLTEDAKATVKSIQAIESDDLILDIGPKTSLHFKQLLAQAGTIVWNGPVGVFEITPFAKGTQSLAEAIAASPAFSVAGGGDTVAAIEHFGVANRINYISTGGGAFLEFLEGKPLPALVALEEKAKHTVA